MTMGRMANITSIRREVIRAILLTSTAVLTFACLVLFGYEFVTFRRALSRELSTLGNVVATNSTAALAFENPFDAEDVLAALKAEPHIAAAALYRKDGTLFSRYPTTLAADQLPEKPQRDGERFEKGFAIAFMPVVQGDNERLGTLYLKANVDRLYARLRVYGTMIAAVMASSVGAAYLMARALQRRVSAPISALAETANAVSQKHDYSVRAPEVGMEELGQLTSAFNHMLMRIQEQTASLSQSEARHRLLFEHSPLPMWVYDLETLRFLAVNGAATLSYGYSTEEFLAMTIADIRPPDELPALRRDLAHSPAKGIQHSTRIWKHRKKDSSIIQVEITSHDFVLEGRPSRLVLSNDVTARVRAEAEIQQLNRELETRVRQRTLQLEAANKELESFSYSVSHDLRAPLRHVQGYVAMLERATANQLSDKARRYLRTIHDASVEMGQLIDDLLEFSRMGRADLIENRIALDELVQQTVVRASSTAQGRNIEWKIAPLPAVIGDAAMLRQVFANLIGNAVKYSRQRDPAVIEIGPVGNPGDEATIFVRDNGAGFDMKYAHKLFGVFQRLHRADEFEGTGIGLATVRRIIGRHGGRIWAEAAVGAGATFFFTIKTAAEPSANSKHTP